jgi:hypothetical protein
MARNLNLLMIQAGGKHINLIVPIKLGPLCISKVEWFDMELGPVESGHVIESQTCPQTMSTKDTSIFQSEGLVLDDDKVRFELVPLSTDGQWKFTFKTEGLEFDFTFVLHDSLTWAQPLSENRKKYFFTHKTLALPLEGVIKVDGHETHCSD